MCKVLSTLVLLASLLIPHALTGQPSAPFVILLHGSIHGSVVDRMTGEAVPNARIKLASTALKGRCNHHGAFSIGIVPAGVYQVNVTGDGYFSLRTRVRIEPDKINQRTFKLLRFKDASEPRRAARTALPESEQSS